MRQGGRKGGPGPGPGPGPVRDSGLGLLKGRISANNVDRHIPYEEGRDAFSSYILSPKR